MAARRQPVKSRRQPDTGRPRWLLPAVVGSLLLVVAGGLAVAYHELSKPGRLPLRVVEINGDFQHLDASAIEQVVMQTIDGGFFSCDMQKLRAAVVAMPWVEDVSIRRSWPDRLSMMVTEEVPLARWGDDALVSVGANVFRPARLDGFTGLVKLSGPLGSQARVVAFLQAVVPPARSRGLTITEIELDERRHWWLRFDGQLTVSLGRDDIENRLAQFFRVYPSLAQQPGRLPERVDMRYAHGFAVRWRAVPGDDMTGDGAGTQEKV